MKNFDYNKEQYRGTVKQLMKVRGIRKISIENYFKWLGEENFTGIHSVKIDLQDGYVNIYNRKEAKKHDEYGNEYYVYTCGDEVEDATADVYGAVYDVVLDIFKNKSIPSNVRRNILVSIGR